MTQLNKIKEILDRQGFIDNFYCIENKISYRLGARIFDLEKQGYMFRPEKVGKNYFYYLVGKTTQQNDITAERSDKVARWAAQFKSEPVTELTLPPTLF